MDYIYTFAIACGVSYGFIMRKRLFNYVKDRSIEYFINNQTTIGSCIRKYENVKTKLNETCNAVYYDIPYMKNIIDSVMYGSSYVVSRIHSPQYMIEPFADNWVNITTLTKNGFHKDCNQCKQKYQKENTESNENQTYVYVSNQHYEYVASTMDGISIFPVMDCIHDYNASISKCIYYDKNTKDEVFDSMFLESLLITKRTMESNKKQEIYYTYRVINDVGKQITGLHENLVPCNKMFLSISYKHPKMKESIHMNIAKSHLVVGNEILSAAFIYRYLEHQSEHFVFDEDYTVEIMDSEINMFSIKSTQHLLLSKDKYKIV